MLAGGRDQSPCNAGFAQPEDVALVLHTAGTTSYAKIVPLSHTHLCASARHHITALALSEGDRCLNVMPLFHIHGLISAMLSSLSGGGSVFCTPGFYGQKFFEWMEAFRPTWYTASPAFHHAILSEALIRHLPRGQVVAPRASGRRSRSDTSWPRKILWLVMTAFSFPNAFSCF